MVQSYCTARWTSWNHSQRSTQPLDLSLRLPSQHTFWPRLQPRVQFFPTFNATVRDRQNLDYILPSLVQLCFWTIESKVVEHAVQIFRSGQIGLVHITTVCFSITYQSSVQESRGLTPYFRVFGHEMSLPPDLMYKPPE